MARFELSKLPDDQGYVVDVQSNHASERKVRTRWSSPCCPSPSWAGRSPTSILCCASKAATTLSLRNPWRPDLREKGERVGSLMAEHGDRFAHVLDILLTGF